MMMNAVKHPLLGDTLYSCTHKSGLRIVVWPQAEASSVYALFATHYGSVNNTLTTPDGGTEVVPEGIAHYLEHKLFEGENGEDAFTRYAQTGANANAYTSFDRTAYLFHATENILPSLEILLDFVQKPYFTEETVQKEQGIIGQEIRMGEDHPGRRVLFNLLRGMYHNHPVRVDIAGTVESISHITPELLYRCYVEEHLLGHGGSAGIFCCSCNEIKFAICRGPKHLGKGILSRMARSGRYGIQDSKDNGVTKPRHLVPIFEERILSPEQVVRYGDYCDSLSCVTEHLRSGHHYDIVVRIFGHSRLERRFIRFSQRLAEVHAHVCKVLDDDGIVLCRQLADDPEFLFRKIEPRRIVRA